MFFIYCLYAMISNVYSCNYDANNLNKEYVSAKYLRLISEWIFNVSLISNISCLKSNQAYEIQAWLGLVMIIIISAVLAALKYRKLSILDDLKH